MHARFARTHSAPTTQNAESATSLRSVPLSPPAFLWAQSARFSARASPGVNMVMCVRFALMPLKRGSAHTHVLFCSPPVGARFVWLDSLRSRATRIGEMSVGGAGAPLFHLRAPPFAACSQDPPLLWADAQLKTR